MGYSKTIIQGRLVRSPDLKTTASGVSVCHATVAVDRPIRKGGNKESDYFDIVAWRGQGEFLANHFRKGDGIIIDGAMQSRKYEKKDGTTTKVWELIADRIDFVASSKKSDDESTGGNDADFTEIDEDDKDLPFD